MTWLINFIILEAGKNFMLHKTAEDIWEAIEETYSRADNVFELFEVETRLYELKQREMNVTQDFKVLTWFWLQLDLYEIYSVEVL